jgi:hypothetical protein
MAVHEFRVRFRATQVETATTDNRRAARQSRARSALMRYLAVWSWVAAMALIAQAIAPSVT